MERGSSVDAADYTIWRNNLGATGLGSLTSVPEPHVGWMIAVTVCGLVGWRRQ